MRVTLSAQKMHEGPRHAWPVSSRKLRRNMSRCHNTCKRNNTIKYIIVNNSTYKIIWKSILFVVTHKLILSQRKCLGTWVVYFCCNFCIFLYKSFYDFSQFKTNTKVTYCKFATTSIASAWTAWVFIFRLYFN